MATEELLQVRTELSSGLAIFNFSKQLKRLGRQEMSVAMVVLQWIPVSQSIITYSMYF